MSFDKTLEATLKSIKVSIPLEQGNVFRLLAEEVEYQGVISFNPFGTGQCLSTKKCG